MSYTSKWIKEKHCIDCILPLINIINDIENLRGHTPEGTAPYLRLVRVICAVIGMQPKQTAIANAQEPIFFVFAWRSGKENNVRTVGWPC